MISQHECVKITTIADQGEFPEAKQLLDRIVHELKPDSEATSIEEEKQETQKQGKWNATAIAKAYSFNSFI